MNLKYIKAVESLKNIWNERNDLRVEGELKFIESYKERISEIVNNAKMEFKDYFKNGFDIEEIKWWTKAQYNDFTVILTTPEANNNPDYELGLAVAHNGRIEYRIGIAAKGDSKHIKPNYIRPVPETIDLLKNGIVQLEKEIFDIEDRKEKIKQTSFYFTCYQTEHPVKKDLKEYANITEILARIIPS